jgi:hypothetical protein
MLINDYNNVENKHLCDGEHITVSAPRRGLHKRLHVRDSILLTGQSGCHGIGDVHNNKTTSAIIGHFRTVSDGVLFFDSQTKNALKVHPAVKIKLPK